MENNPIWLSITLFCNKDQWNDLFLNRISSFLTVNQYLIEEYIIKLNYPDSENIELSFLTGETTANELVRKTDEYFKAHFLKPISLPESAMSSLKNTATPFLENTVQFNLHPLKKIKRSEKKYYSLSMGLSQIMLDTLKDDVIDNEAILTLLFYLQIGLIKIIKNINPDFVNTLKQVIVAKEPDHIENFGHLSFNKKNHETITPNGWMDKMIINAKFEENSKFLSEIVSHIMSADNQADVPEWMKKWLIICKKEIGKPGADNLATIYKRIVNTIYQHLGVTTETSVTLSYFIQRALGLMNPPGAILIGAQKCGTSTLHFTLVAHSHINGPVNPENHTHVKEIDFFYNNKNWEKGIDWYYSHFTGSKDLFLDSSPNYLSLLSCFSRIQMLVPDAKFIICIRDPVYRAFSQYNHYKQMLPASEKWDWKYGKDFLTNIKTGLDTLKINFKRDPDFLDSKISFSGLLLRGVYINQINHLLNYYDRSQIYITIMDRWPLNYETEINNILAFLGLEKEVLPPVIENKRDYTVEPFCDEAKEILTEFYKPYNEKLFEFLGYEIPEWG